MTDVTAKTKLENFLKFNYWVYIAIVVLPIDIGTKLFSIQINNLWSIQNLIYIPSFLIILLLFTGIETFLLGLLSIPGGAIFDKPIELKERSSDEFSITDLKRFAIKENSQLIWGVTDKHDIKHQKHIANSKLYFKCLLLFILDIWFGSSVSILPFDLETLITIKVLSSILFVGLLFFYAKESFKPLSHYIKVSDFLGDIIERTGGQDVGIHKLESLKNELIIQKTIFAFARILYA